MFTEEQESQLLHLIKTGFIPFTHAENVDIILQYVKGKNSTDQSQIADGRDIIVVVGPSGSGKTTFIANMYNAGLLVDQNGKFIPFVNRFFNNQKMTLQEEIDYKAGLLEAGKSFMLESAQFDDNYFEFIKLAKLKYGYNIQFIYLTKANPQENISMVQKRKTQGGHGRATVELNEDVLEEMYRVDSQNLVRILPYCDSCFVIKNETMGDSSNQKPVVLLQKKLTGEFEFDTRYHYARFLHDNILGIKSTPVRPRIARAGGRARVVSPKIITTNVARRTKLPQSQVLCGRIQTELARISGTPLDVLDSYTPEQQELIIQGRGPGMGRKK